MDRKITKKINRNKVRKVRKEKKNIVRKIYKNRNRISLSENLTQYNKNKTKTVAVDLFIYHSHYTHKIESRKS
jgi:hypothetical protein